MSSLPGSARPTRIQAFSTLLRSKGNGLRQGALHWWIFGIILALGIFARALDFGRVPPGLTPDEASIGAEANSLLRFGLDTNGNSYPIQFVAWGDGQSTPYAYLLMPILALTQHISPTIVRLPMLITAVASLPLIYLIGRWTIDPGFGLLAMLSLAISPWHIMLSRWALDANLLPFFFVAAFACLLRSARDPKWFIAGCVLFALCLYAYATAYAMLPTFVALALLLIWRTRAVPCRYVLAGLAILALLAVPIGMFILVNSARLNSISLGPVTIPRFPMPPRYETQTLMADMYHEQTVLGNLAAAGALLVTQTDGLPQNGLDPYGYFYTLTFPLALVGIWYLIRAIMSRAGIWQAGLLLCWILASFSIALLQPVNINRFNIIFIPIIICIALAVYRLGSLFPPILPAAVLLLLAGFAAFTVAYHGPAYRNEASSEFRTGIVPALTFAEQVGAGPICVSSQSGQYVYALFTDPMNPADYLPSVRYDDPTLPGRTVISLGRYSFGTRNCPEASGTTYVSWTAESPPRLGNRYDYKFFDNYVVYYPQQ